MQIIKKIIRYAFNLMELQIISMNEYNAQQDRISEMILTANRFYKESLESRLDSLSDSEYLQYLELKFGGWITNIKPTISKEIIGRDIPMSHSGGDKFNVFRIINNYSDIYSKNLKPLRSAETKLIVVEIGILKGTSLAIWDKYFTNKKIYGLDFDLGNFRLNQDYLISIGAFKDGIPELVYYDQLGDNSQTLNNHFLNNKIDIVVDDALHSDDAIVNSFNELHPYLNEKFIYFIEDNQTAWKKLKSKYPDFNFEFDGNRLTVVTR